MNKPKTCTDTFRFETQPFFEQLRKAISNRTVNTQNLIECKDDMLFAWNPSDCCVIAFNWRLAQTKGDDNVNFQTLIPSTPVDYVVNKVTASHEGQYLALSGSRGVAIMEIPCRYGPNGQYKEGKPRILCTTHILDENYFASNTLVCIQQVRWHPASPKDSNLMVLLSNNSIRTYDEAKLQHIWKIGPTPCAPTRSSLPYLNSLGDTAVDFDISAPRVTAMANANTTLNTTNNDTTVNGGASTKNVEWPLVILFGNGNLYIALIGLDTDKPRIQGPLTIYPSTKDNYGLDSCTILALPSNPTTLVVAESSGRLFHMILVESEAELNNSENYDENGLKYEPCEWIVNVVEVVELEFGLKSTENKDDENNQIFLKADINNDSRYFVYHNAGLHAISIEFLPTLQRYFEDNGDSIDIESILSNFKGNSEYLVALDAKLNAVVGFCLLQSPPGLVLVLSSGQVVTLNVITNPSFLRNIRSSASSSENPKETTESAMLNSKVFSGSFVESIRQMLASGTTQPILKLNERTPKESLELLLDAFQRLRDQYISKHDSVRQKIEQRVKILRVLDEQQRQEVAELLQEKCKLRENAEHLAEKYEEINDRQQALMKSLHEILRLINLRMPSALVAERNFSEQINKIHAITKDLANNIAACKKKMEKQQRITTTDKPAKVLTLQPKQETVLKEIIGESNTQIETQINEIKRIKKTLNMD
ncbi:nuclear pore complex protein Nup88 [Contarinia nasturtii]|uniref:nuclear pore complex protein Nup88 n=1 Tax=Contarinia nasturtii TaxID=265458 RepID=UPI0012D425B6|nr:nuclear pore complex protein Nup88 [Contarinia nasturtii]